MKQLALILALACASASAEPPADAPVVLQVERAHVLTPAGEWRWVGKGEYLDERAAVRIADHVVQLEAQADPAAQSRRIAAALVLGFSAGIATGFLLHHVTTTTR